MSPDIPYRLTRNDIRSVVCKSHPLCSGSKRDSGTSHRRYTMRRQRQREKWSS